MSTPWKYTIPVLRAEERPDGLYVIGEASGPERDTFGTEMDPAAILQFARQIEDASAAGNPIPYIDSHMKVGVMRELGHLEEASITPNYHLKVAVRLDEENPAAAYHYKQIQRGKQYGMSVKGDGVDYIITKDPDTGHRVMRFTNVLLREISATTAPSWVPSFGTVLARSAQGEDNEGEPEMPSPEQPAQIEETAEAAQIETTDTAAPIETPAVVNEPVAVRSEDPAESPVETQVEVPEAVAEVERARISKADREALESTLTAFLERVKLLGIEPVAESETTADEPTEPVVRSADPGPDLVDFHGISIERSAASALTDLLAVEIERATVEFQTQIAEKDARIAEKDARIKDLESTPATTPPAPVVRDKFGDDDENERFSKLTPNEKLRAGLAAVYGNR